jgi:hypothetical protein
MLIVTVRDSDTGEEQTRELPEDDYIVITTGSCSYAVQAHANGTHVVTIKGRKPGLTVQEGGQHD